MNKHKSHGDGAFTISDFKDIGPDVVFEKNVLVFHPETIAIGENVYIGHNTILKGYYQNEMVIGRDTWIGQNCFFHSAGGLHIGSSVGIGPCVKIITSFHKDEITSVPLLHNPLQFKAVTVCDGADIGVGAIILPGSRIGVGGIVGAGAVVTDDVPDFAVVAGVPAKVIRYRKEKCQ